MSGGQFESISRRLQGHTGEIGAGIYPSDVKSFPPFNKIMVDSVFYLHHHPISWFPQYPTQSFVYSTNEHPQPTEMDLQQSE